MKKGGDASVFLPRRRGYSWKKVLSYKALFVAYARDGRIQRIRTLRPLSGGVRNLESYEGYRLPVHVSRCHPSENIVESVCYGVTPG